MLCLRAVYIRINLCCSRSSDCPLHLLAFLCARRLHVHNESIETHPTQLTNRLIQSNPIQSQLNIAGYGHGTMHVNLGGVFGACTGGMEKL